MIRMLIVGYCYGIRFERRLCEEVELHLAYRWFCRLDLDDKVPDHSTFSVNRHGRFRDSNILRLRRQECHVVRMRVGRTASELSSNINKPRTARGETPLNAIDLD